MQRLTFGSITVDAVIDGNLKMPLLGVIPGAGLEAYTALGGVDAEGNVGAVLTTFVIRTGAEVILVDTGVGPELGSMADMDAGTPVGLLPASLAAAGVAPEAVTHVVFTHLHGDHIGWNAIDQDGARRPMFPNARYIVTRTEWEARFQVAGKRSVATCLTPVEAAGQLVLVDDGHRVAPGVELFATPGHTPGHTSVLVMGGDGGGIITGDVTHHPGEIEDPDVKFIYDADPDRSIASRKTLIARAAADGLVVMGGHFPPPTAGHVVMVEGRRRWRWLGA